MSAIRVRRRRSDRNWQTNTFPIDLRRRKPGLPGPGIRSPAKLPALYPHGRCLVRSNFGHSTFHSGTVKLEKRFSQGFFFNTFYTFSKSINSQDTDNSGSGLALIQNRSLEEGSCRL